MTITIASPNPDNYVVGKGRIYFQPEGMPGVVTDYPVGNVTEFELSPTIEKLDHFSSMEGTRSKDKSIVLEKGLTARIVMEEWTPRNMQLMLIGALDTTDPANVTVDILSENAVAGHLMYVGTNDVGPKWTFDLPSVEFSPSGSLNPISDEWGGMEVTAEVLLEGGTFGTASADFSVGAANPANTIPPTIYGTAALAQTLHALHGTWTGFPHVYGYQWQRDPGTGFVNIAGATAKDYLVAAPVVAGDAIRVQVTATNLFGTAAAVNSAPTADVP